MSYFDNLPTELWFSILTKIDLKDFCNTALVSSPMCNILYSDMWWKQYVNVNTAADKHHHDLRWNWLAENVIRGSPRYITDDNDKKIYCGEVLKNTANGFGIMYDNEDKIKYLGLWRNGKAHGWGEYIPRGYSNDKPVTGWWRNGNMPRCSNVSISLNRKYLT